MIKPTVPAPSASTPRGDVLPKDVSSETTAGKTVSTPTPRKSPVDSANASRPGPAPAATPHDSVDTVLPNEEEQPDGLNKGLPTRPSFPRPKARTLVSVVVSLLAALFVFNLVSNQKSSPPVADPQAQKTEAAPDTSKILSDEVAGALMFKETNGTFRGFSPSIATGQVLVAAGNDTFIVSYTDLVSCTYAGFVDGETTPVLVDETSQACQAANVQEAQAAIDASEAAGTEYDTAIGASALTVAISNLQQIAALGGGLTSGPFTGLTGIQFDGATVVQVDPQGTSATVQAQTETSCMTATVFSDGTATTPAPCG